MSVVCSSHKKISKKTLALAFYIVDFYFANGNKCKLKLFQLFGTACLIFAIKMEGEEYINFGLQKTEFEQVLALEQDIYLKLNFQLTPITFIDIGEALKTLWIRFCEQMKNETMINKGLKFK
jgi:hypothetical protein